jgi:methionine-rich copper-binding protein CopC
MKVILRRMDRQCHLNTGLRLIQPIIAFWIMFGSLLGVSLDVRAAVITFQTEAGSPRIVSSNPAHLQTLVLTNTQFQIDFDQQMNTSTLNTTNIKLIDLATGEIPPNWASAPIANSPTQFRITSGIGLEANRSYALVLTTGVRSVSDRPLDPADTHHRSGTIFGEAWVIEFSTGITLGGPTITGTIIGGIPGGATGGQVNVPINATIIVAFERAMDSSKMTTTNIVLRKQGSAAALTATLNYDAIANMLTVTPSALLEYNSTYELTLTNLTDLLNNVLP